MKQSGKTSRLVTALTALTALAMIPTLGLTLGLLAAGPATAASSTGWVRLAHLSPNTPAVDVYLYAFGSPTAELVLKHVTYGTVSPYENAAAGEYTVAMRPAGARSSTPPVLSTTIAVTAGDAYTVAGMGPASGLRLQVLHDELTTPPGQTLVRVIQASLTEHKVTVTVGTRVLARQLPFATVTGYRTVSPGDKAVHVAGGSADTARNVPLGANTIHTLVVLDQAGGIEVVNLEDASGSHVMPVGGVATGLGGTAPAAPGRSPVPWLASIAGGAILAVAATIRLRRMRERAIRVP
jgi:hypothetical protein